MALTRKEHWAEKEFHDFLLAREKVPFQWSLNDCCTFAADAIEAITGTDMATEFRGNYKNEAGGFALIKKITGGSGVAAVAAYCATKYGLVEYEFPKKAKRGDLVVVDNNGTLIAAIVHLNGRHVISVSEDGLVRLPITSVKRAWAV